MANTQGIQAGKAYVSLYLDDNPLTRGLNAAQGKIKAFGNELKNVGKDLMVASLAILGPLALSSNVFATFETQMAAVSTMLTEPDKHMEEFGATVRAMSIRFGESTESLSKGLYDILSASVAAESALGVLNVSAKAATAGLSTTGVAADAITTILNSYKMSAYQAGSVSDWLFTVVKRGKTTFGELAPAIGNVATIASSAHVPLNEVGAALATMTRNGVKTDNAVTSLNAIISSFLQPTEEAAQAAKALGFEMSTTTLQIEGLVGVFDKIKNLPPDAIGKLFPNIRALKGVLPALSNMDGFLEDIAAMANSAGNTDEAFLKMASTSGQAFKSLKMAVIDLGVSIGKAIAEPVKKLAVILAEVSKFISGMAERNKELLITIAKIAAVVFVAGSALTGFGFAMIGISKAIGTLLFGLKLIAGVFGFILSPMTLVIGAIGVATYMLVSHFDIIKSVGNGIGETFSKAANWISTSNNIVAQSLSFLGQSVKTTFSLATTTFSGIRDALKAGDIEAAFDIAVLGLKAIWKKFSFDFKAIWYGVQEVLLSAWFSTVEAIKNKFNDVLNFFGKVQNKVSEWMMEATLWVMGESDNPYAKDTLSKMTEASKNETESEYQKRQDEIAEESRKNNEALDLLRTEHTNNLIKQDEELAAATKRLQDATNKAADAVKSKEEKDAEAKAATVPDVSNLLSGVGAAIAIQASTIFGTFNAMGGSGLQGWGYGNNSEWQATLKAIANNTKSTADNTEEIKNKDGMTFTDS